MNKRGQVTIFILLGLLIIAIIGLVYFLRQPNINITNIITTRTVSLKDNVNDCLKKTSNEGLTLIGKQGGDISPNFYLNYCNKETCDQVAYLCYVDGYNSCTNLRPFLDEHIKDELKQYVEKNIKSCINLDNWRNIGYEVNEDDVNVNVEIGERNVLVLMDYDISIIKDQVTQSENKFSQSLPVPIGLITQATKDIVASEIARGDFFDQPFYIKHRGEIVVVKTFVGDSKIYEIKIRDLNDPLQYVPYEFKFAIKSWVTS